MTVSEYIENLKKMPPDVKIGILLGDTLISVGAPSFGKINKDWYAAPPFKDGEEIVFL